MQTKTRNTFPKGQLCLDLRKLCSYIEDKVKTLRFKNSLEKEELYELEKDVDICINLSGGCRYVCYLAYSVLSLYSSLTKKIIAYDYLDLVHRTVKCAGEVCYHPFYYGRSCSHNTVVNQKVELLSRINYIASKKRMADIVTFSGKEIIHALFINTLRKVSRCRRPNYEMKYPNWYNYYHDISTFNSILEKRFRNYCKKGYLEKAKELLVETIENVADKTTIHTEPCLVRINKMIKMIDVANTRTLQNYLVNKSIKYFGSSL